MMNKTGGPPVVALPISKTITPETSPMPGDLTSATSGLRKCTQCKACFAKPSKLHSHIMSVHENARPYQCTKCDDSFKRKDHLTRHMASKHAENRNVYQCPLLEQTGCLMSFPNKDQLRKHVSRTHEKRIKCIKCPDPRRNPEEDQQYMQFQKKSQLRKHMFEIHGEGYTCAGHCGRKFDKKKYLTQHLARV